MAKVFGPNVRVLACTAVLAAAAVATYHAQLPPAGPVAASEISIPAIDRGLRNFDPPRNPRNDAPDITVSGDEPFLSRSIIVKFRPGTSPDAQRRLLAQVDGAASRPLSYANFDIVSIDPNLDPEAAARQLGAQPDVEYAQARYVVYPRFTPNDPLFAQQWNYTTLDMERAWDINPGASPSVIVAV